MPEGVEISEFGFDLDGFDFRLRNIRGLAQTRKAINGTKWKSHAFVELGGRGVERRRGLPEGVDESHSASG